ncbi:MAG: apolipoprotein N-acyltransferase [Vicingaceae bacterium]
MSKFKIPLYSIASGVLLALSWPAVGDMLIMAFYALFPLLVAEDKLSKQSSSGLKVFGYAYLTFFVFNLMTTWWIYYASDWGAVMAIVFNALFMAITFWLFHQTKKKVGRKEGYIGLIIYWVAFEYLHINWELSWPWLTFGNVFSNSPNYVQWYEYTGVLGGSALIIILNLLFFQAFKDLRTKSNVRFGYIAFFIILIVGVLFISGAISPDKNSDTTELEVVIIQPNIDPYYDKFQGISESDQIDRMLAQAKSAVTDSTDLVILPETAFPQPFWEHDLDYMYGTEEFRSLIEEYPKLRVITGILSSRLYLEGDKLSATAKKLPGEGWYDNYNAAMQLDSSSKIDIHRKSKLVLGAEKIPFLKSIPLLKKLSVSLGGTTGRYGTQEKPTVFFNQNGEHGVAPIICYESIYGEYVNQYAQQGAELYAIITNDGWWDNTPGYEQHLAYARLRAIEGRRNIVRSANTGISAVINAKGELVEQTNWWEQAVLKTRVQLNSTPTFYIRYGDYLGRIASFIAILLLLLTVVKSLNKTEQRLNLKKR